MLTAIAACWIASASPFLPAGTWLTNYDQAKRHAAALNRTILLNFTGSDWCSFCARLKKEVFDSETFISWADQNAILVTVDFPRNTPLPPEVVKQNDDLQTEFAVGGYPSIVFANATGELLGTSGYLPKPGPRTWIDHAERVLYAGRQALQESTGYPSQVPKQLGALDYRGKPFPLGALKELAQGKNVNFENKLILVDFWATYCSPCVKEMPRFERLAKKYAQDLVIIGVSDEPTEKISQFAVQRDLTYPLVSDPGAKLHKEVGIQVLPQQFLISSDGIVRWQGGSGDGDPLTEGAIIRAISAQKEKR